MLGISLEVILAIALVRTGRGVIIGAMVVVLALTGGMLILERLVVTENEAVEDALDQVAAALAANDRDAVLASFSPQSPRRAEVQSLLSRVTVSSARIGGDLEVRFNELASPPSATTYFTGIVNAKDTGGAIPYEHMMRKFKVTMRKEDGRWLIFDYAEAESRRKG
jgi:ketosteroid isomerase-like protein